MQTPPSIRISILAALIPILALAGSPSRSVSEVPLSSKLTEPLGWTAALGHPMIAVAFSPDGGKLAATMDDHYQAGRFQTHLLIVDLLNPQGAVRQFDLESCGKFLAWAPDGRSLLVCSRFVAQQDQQHLNRMRQMEGLENDALPARHLAVSALPFSGFTRPRKGSSASSSISLRMRLCRSGGIASSCLTAAS